MKYLLFIILILFYSCHSNTSKKGQEYETDSSSQQKELYPDSISKSEPILMEEEQEQPLETTSFVPQPIPCDIPTGEAINPDSLSMETEYAYYPLSTTKVKISVTNHSRQKYTCGNEYSLTFYNSSKRQWETLPTNPDIKDIGWVLYPQYSPYQSTGKLFTFEVPNRPGKYRIYKTFYRDTKKKVAYAEFEILPEDGAERMLKIVDEYLDKYRNKEDAVSQNFSTWGLRGDTLDMTWSVNSPYMRNLFRERVLSYSATVVNNGKETTTRTLDRIAYTDTLDVTMKTEKPIYPVGTKLVKVTLTNNNENELSIGTDYYIVRKEKDRWVFLHGDQIWNLVEIRMQQNDSYTFHAALYPLLNNNLPGIYRVNIMIYRTDLSAILKRRGLEL